MTTTQILKDKGLVIAFKRYRRRYLSAGKKPDVTKLLAYDLYSTMRLEGEKITKEEAQALYK